MTPKKSIPPPQASKIKDWKKFQEFVELHGDQTQKEIAKLWGDVSPQTISRGLRKLGYSRKKASANWRGLPRMVDALKKNLQN